MNKLTNKKTFVVEKASIRDVWAIQRLIDFYAEKKILLPRTADSIFENIRDFFVARDEFGNVIGCLVMHITTHNMAEIRSFAVDERYQELGIGRQLMDACLEEAKLLQLDKIFALTYTDKFFEKFDFSVIDKAELPHKIWNDCLGCAHYHDCDEIAMIKFLGE